MSTMDVTSDLGLVISPARPTIHAPRAVEETHTDTKLRVVARRLVDERNTPAGTR